MAPAAAGAGCMTEGQMPLSIHFDSDTREQGFTVNDGLLKSITMVPGSGMSVSEMQFGIYMKKQMTDGEVATWDWGDQPLVAVQDLPVDQKVALEVSMTSHGNTSPIHVSFLSHGAESLTIGDCTYPVVHITRRYDFDGDQGAIAGEIWVDPAHLLMLKQDMNRIDGTGAVIGHRASVVDQIVSR